MIHSRRQRLVVLVALLADAWLQPLLAAAGAVSGSVFASAATEEAALTLAETVDLKSLSAADMLYLIKERHWLPVAQRLLTRSQATPLDFSAPVRSAVSAVRKELDDLIRGLDKSYGEASLVSPAFQWAQNSSHIFLQVKFAQRWNAPGALEVQNTSIAVSDCCFSFKGFGEHSMIRKEYKLLLQFLDKVAEEGSSWHFAAAGRLTVTVAKVRTRRWERLLRSENVQPENMGVWQDMQAKWKSELAAFEGKKKGAQKKRPSGEDEEEEDDDDKDGPECEPGAFEDSKVVELCPEAFLTGGPSKLWSVLFYASASTAMKAQNYARMWRALADMAPAHNKNAMIGALDCSRFLALCQKQKVKQKDLPSMQQFSPGVKSGSKAFVGEPTLEDLVAWASGARQEL